jgi:hypothetical protein
MESLCRRYRRAIARSGRLAVCDANRGAQFCCGVRAGLATRRSESR